MQYYLRNDYLPKAKRYSYPINNFAGVDSLSDENNLPLTYCSYGYNIGFKNGALTNGMGIAKAKINGTLLPSVGATGCRIIKCWIYYKYNYTLNKREDKIVVLLDNNTVYTTLLDGATGFTQTTMTFSSGTASALNYHFNGEDVFLIFGSAGGMYLYNGESATHYNNVPGFSSVCLHYERIYGTTQQGSNRVYFSDDLDPTNWQISLNEAGYISFPDEGGRVKKVESFNDYVFIFREYGIHRLTAYTDLTDYKITKVFSTSNKIYAETIKVCGNKMVFLAEDGLYSFDGFVTKKIYAGLFPLIGNKEYAVASYFNYKYYLAVNLKILDDSVVGDEEKGGMKNNGIVSIDFDLGDVNIFRGGDVACFLPVNMSNFCELLVAFNNFRCVHLGMICDSGTIMDVPLNKLWRSPLSHLAQLDGNKILRKIYLLTNGALKLTVNGDEKFEKDIQCSPYIQVVPINRGGESISIALQSDSDKLYISGMLLEFDVFRRRYGTNG